MDFDEARALFKLSVEAWNRGDMDSVIHMYDPDCEWDNRQIPIDPVVYRGHDGLRAVNAMWLGNWTEFRIDLVEIEQLDDDEFRLLGRGTGVGNSGIPVDMPMLVQRVTMRGGKVLSVRNSFDESNANGPAEAGP